MNNEKGFTLVELMIVVAVVAILVALAYPSYGKYVLRANRADAKKALLDLHLGQAKWRGTHTTYSSTVTDVYTSTTSTDGFYTISIASSSASAYVAKATPKVGTIQPNDSCGVFTLNEAGPDISTTALKKCWQK